MIYQIEYSHSSEVPKSKLEDFHEYMELSQLRGIMVRGIDEVVYRTSDVCEYLKIQEGPFIPPISDLGEFVKELDKGQTMFSRRELG